MLYATWLLFSGAWSQVQINWDVEAPVTGASVAIFYSAGVVFAVSAGLMLALDLGVFHRKSHAVSGREALTWSLVWIALSLTFNTVIYFFWDRMMPSSSYTNGEGVKIHRRIFINTGRTATVSICWYPARLG